MEEPEEKVYEIPNNQVIQTIKIHNTKNSPESHCYFVSCYSPMRKDIIFIGGTNKENNQEPIVYSYIPKSREWKECKDEYIPFDKAITGHAGALFYYKNEETLFIFGGFGEGDIYTNHMYALPTESLSFSQIGFNKNRRGIAEYPTPRSYHTLNYDRKNKKLYVYGGSDMNISNSNKEIFQCLWEFDLTNSSWEKIPLNNIDKKGAPRGHTAILKEKQIYVFGGVVLFKKFLNNLFIIDIDKKEIKNIAYSGAIPQPVAFHAACEVNDECFIIQGGLDKNYNVINDCYTYYYKTRTFTKIEIPLIPKLFGHKLVNVPERKSIFIIGGMDSFEYVGDKDLIFNPEREGDKLIQHTDEELKYTPMKQILEMVIKQ